MAELTFLSAVSLARKVREKKLSSVEIVEAHLKRIDQLHRKLNAFVDVNADGALRRARMADEALGRGEQLGPLHGIPLSIKSSIDVEGLSSETGSRLRAGYRAPRDAPLVSRLRNAGAIILGTTNCPELLMAWETDNLLFGRTQNPWDLSRTPGGSSGGEAAAIASGCSAGGVGSDGGGSIRVPAHFSGICGLKPTPGRIPATGHFPPSLGPFALLGVVGPMARTVGDARLLFETIQGPEDGDASSVPVAIHWPALEELKRLRIGYFEDDGCTPVTPETRTAVRTAAEALARAGFEVQPFRPQGLEQARHLWWQLFRVGGSMLLDPMTKGRESELSPILKQFSAWASAEPPHTARTLLETWMMRDSLRAKVFEQMRTFPILLCPVAAIPAFHHGERSWKIDGKTVDYLDAWSYTAWFNLLGTPAVSVPVSLSREGLPIGVQISARPWQEEVVLAIAEVVEKECGGWKPPPIDA
ncbi:MAG TPA: amidase [Terriglobales bacterium]|nr:amidase [Terriglobales bacterium]